MVGDGVALAGEPRRQFPLLHSAHGDSDGLSLARRDSGFTGDCRRRTGPDRRRRRQPAPQASMTRDKLIILHAGFSDPAYPGQRFYCWHCMLIEGLLAAYPELLSRIDVDRIAWPKPRPALVALVGTENQSVPVLILADDAPSGMETGRFGDRRFVAGNYAILKVLPVRPGIPDPHP